MGDLISRAAAIDYLMTNMNWHDEDGYTVDDADEKRAIITDLVNGIPAVETVPVKHGRWEADSDGLPVCSVCDEVAMQRLHCDSLHWAWRYDVRLVKTPYCPNCGAKMDGV
jgi:hypothetical protein